MSTSITRIPRCLRGKQAPQRVNSNAYRLRGKQAPQRLNSNAPLALQSNSAAPSSSCGRHDDPYLTTDDGKVPPLWVCAGCGWSATLGNLFAISDHERFCTKLLLCNEAQLYCWPHNKK